MTYDEAMEYLDEAAGYGIVPGLDSIRELLRRMDHPQEHLNIIHVAGTNGKGSTAAYIASILRVSGFRVGRYNSPSVYGYCERILIGLRRIPKKAVGEWIGRIRVVCDEMVADGLPHPTPFEIETAMAFGYFREQECDFVVLETGMGGTYDATNIVDHTMVAVITSIGMDHMQFLGDTLPEIAAHKAGILKKGCEAVSLTQPVEAMEVIEKRAEALGCPLTVTDASHATHIHFGKTGSTFDYGRYKKLSISLLGRHQVDNAVVAIEAVEALGRSGVRFPERAIYQGLAETVWSGRLQILSKRPAFVIDGAHNEDAARKLADAVELYFSGKRIIYICGMLRDKECGRVLEIMAPFAEQLITVTPPENPRAMHAYELAQLAMDYYPSVTSVDSLEEAVELSHLLAGKEDIILCFGSLSFLGRMTKLIETRNVK